MQYTPPPVNPSQIENLEVLDSLTVDQVASGGGSVSMNSSPLDGSAVLEASPPFGSGAPVQRLHDADGNIAHEVKADGTTTMIPPSADPHVEGALWNNSGVLAISAG